MRRCSGPRVAACEVMWTNTKPLPLLAAILGLFVLGRAGPAAAQEATLTELGGAKTQGIIEVDASPTRVYAVMTGYANWPHVLTDVKSAAVKAGGREDAKVRFDSRAMKHAVTVQFDNDADVALRFRMVDGPRGARATGEYLVVSLDGGRRTRITATLYMNVVGVVGWLVRDKTIRKMRQQKLRTDLEDVARYLDSLP